MTWIGFLATTLFTAVFFLYSIAFIGGAENVNITIYMFITVNIIDKI